MGALTIVFLLNVFHFSCGLVCYRCEKQSDLTLCRSAVECRADEICHGFFSEDQGTVRYTLGCIPKTICDKYIFGKRSHYSSGCCLTNYCNLDLVKPDVTSTALTTKVTTTQILTTTTRVTTTIPPCVDHDSRCSQSVYRALLCDPNASPDTKKYAISTCPLACNYCPEWYAATLTKMTTKNQTTTILTTTTTPTTTTPPEPVQCHLCRGPKFICERSHAPQKCTSPDHQFCINDIENLIDGSRYISRRCATKNECIKDWNQESADRSECIHYGEKIVKSHFYCSFCCKGDNCNSKIVPENLYQLSNSTSFTF